MERLRGQPVEEPKEPEGKESREALLERFGLMLKEFREEREKFRREKIAEIDWAKDGAVERAEALLLVDPEAAEAVDGLSIHY